MSLYTFLISVIQSLIIAFNDIKFLTQSPSSEINQHFCYAFNSGLYVEIVINEDTDVIDQMQMYLYIHH